MAQPINLVPQEGTTDEIMQKYYSQQLNNIKPSTLVRVLGPASKPYVDLKRWAEYIQEKEFYENNNQKMPESEYYPGKFNSGMENPLFPNDKGHEGLLNRQKSRGLLDEGKLQQIIDMTYGKGAV